MSQFTPFKRLATWLSVSVGALALGGCVLAPPHPYHGGDYHGSGTVIVTPGPGPYVYGPRYHHPPQRQIVPPRRHDGPRVAPRPAPRMERGSPAPRVERDNPRIDRPGPPPQYRPGSSPRSIY